MAKSAEELSRELDGILSSAKPPTVASTPAPAGENTAAALSAELDSILGAAPAAVPQAPMAPRPEIKLKDLDPSLDDSLDGPGPLERGRILQEEIKKRLAPGFIGMNPLFPTPAASRAASDFLVGAGRTALAGIKGLASLGPTLNQAVNRGEEFVPEVYLPSGWLYYAGKAADKIEKSFLPPEVEKSWVDSLPEAAGSTLTFVAGGAGLRKLAGWGVPKAVAFLGASVGAGEQVEDAVMNNATPDQQALAAVGGATFGASEAIPGTWFLKRLNRLSNGQVYKLLEQANSNGNPSLFWNALKGFGTEGGQEGFQTLGSNWVASDLAGYDPTRSVGENFWASVFTGGVIGSSVAGGIALIEKGQRNVAIAELEKQYLGKLASGDPINTVEGTFTPVDDLVQMRKMKADIDAKIQREGAQLVDPANPDPVWKPQTPEEAKVLSSSRKEPFSFDNDLSDPELSKPFLEAKAELFGRKPKNPDPAAAEPTVADILAKKPVAIKENSFYASLVEKVEQQNTIQQLKLSNLILEDKKKSTPETKAALAKQRVLAGIFMEKLTDARSLRDQDKRLMKEAQNYAAKFRENLLDDWKIVLVSDTSLLAKKDATSNGAFKSYIDKQLDPVNKVAVITLNTEKILNDRLYNQRNGLRKDSLDRRFFETLNHELGHLANRAYLHEIYRKSIDDTAPPAERVEARNTFNYIFEEYQRWLNDAVTKPYAFLLQTQMAPERAAQITDASGRASNAVPLVDLMPNKDDNESPYFYSFEEFFAEQVSRAATQGRLADPIGTKFFNKVVDSYKKVYESLHPDAAKLEYGAKWLEFLQGQITGKQILDEVEKLASNRFNGDLIGALRGKFPGFNPDNYAGLKEHLDRWNDRMRYGLNLVQMVKEFPHITHWQTYMNAVEGWAAYQRNFGADAVEIIQAWRNLGKNEASQLTDVLYEEGLSRKFLPKEVLEKRLSGEALEVYDRVRQQLDRVLEEMRAVALDDEAKSRGANEEENAARLKEINDEFDKMKKGGYFPFLRFGKYTITARATQDLEYEGKKYRKGKLITFPVFEEEADRDAAVEELKKEFGNKAVVSPSVMKETEFAIQGMPRSLLRTMKTKLELTGKLNPDQREALDRAIEEAAPFRNFKKQFLKKKKIKGYSQDAMRSFAYYMRSGAGHIARVKYADQFRDAIQGMQNDANIIQEVGGRAQDRQEMRHWMDRHLDYIMNPTEEWAALRGAGFVAYLGFNIKSAAVNLTQIVTTVAPYLAARYGDKQAIAALGRATRITKDWWTNREKYVRDLKISESRHWEKNRIAAVRVGEIGDGSHFATLGGAEELFDDLTGRDEAKYYDLSQVKVAPPTPEVWKQIFEKTLELELAGKRPKMNGGEGPLASVKSLLPPEELIAALQEKIADKSYFEVANFENEELGLYRGALALGYEGVYVMESDEYFDSESTVNVFAGREKIKEISRKQFDENVRLIKDGVPDAQHRLTKMYAQGLHEGWLDQSLATELAIAASENTLDRSLPYEAHRGWYKFAGWSALPFHLVEKMNRYITATAAYELEFAKSQDHAKAVAAAKMANYSANYENARWNRPEFMRGKKSVALLFMNYVQNTLYFATKDPGAVRYWMVMLLLGGVLGEPFAEDIVDLVNFAATGLNRLLGLKNPKVQLQQLAREHLLELELNPDLILHGLSQSSFGWGQLGELTGLPIPKFDLSGSVGLGNAIPMTEIPGQMLQKDSKDVLANALASAAGASGNLVADYYDALMSPNRDDWKKMEKLAPLMSVRNLSKAIRLAVRGKEETAAGDVIAKFDPYDPRDFAEILGQGMGFTPSRLSKGWELYIAKKDLVEYYKVQQQAIVRRLSVAFMQEDREAKADALKALDEYNKMVPMKDLRLNGKDVNTSILNYIRQHKVRELGWAAERKYRRLEKSLEQNYPDFGADGPSGDN